MQGYFGFWWKADTETHAQKYGLLGEMAVWHETPAWACLASPALAASLQEPRRHPSRVGAIVSELEFDGLGL